MRKIGLCKNIKFIFGEYNALISSIYEIIKA